MQKGSGTTEPDRPDPDQLLRRYGSEPANDRGKLHVYLGSAPGVGKTFAMLNEGHRLQREGVDVVVGLVETHGRAETAALLHDLEIIPRRTLRYRGTEIEEMDVDAILQRAPAIVLVDELAHTNVPGSERPKRWQDVERLRDAGIDVLTTVNIQHLESLNDVVENITGVKVRETIPDQVLDSATEVQLVDLPVTVLVERLEEGKIYPDNRARQALENFFREGNLTALRELALRRTASGVDEQLEGYMRDHAIEEVWGASERVLALLSPGPEVNVVVRSAWRLADGLRGELVALAVVPTGGIAASSASEQQAWAAALELAEDLGASVRIIESDDRLEAVVAAIRDLNVSTLVMEYVPPSGLAGRMKGSFLDKLMAAVDGMEVHLVERGKSASKP